MMTFDTFFMVLVILGVCYRMSTLTGVFETEAFLFRVIKGLFYLLLWKGLVWFMPFIGKSVDNNIREFITIGIPTIVVLAWFVAPWVFTINRLVKRASLVEILGWVSVSSLANFTLAIFCNAFL